MIETERLTIRRIRFDDWQAIQAIWAEVAQTEFAQYDRPFNTDDEFVMERVEKWASFSDSTEHMFFAVYLEKTVIGYIVLNQRENGYEIGYCFHPVYHGQGYARESISALLKVLKEQGVLYIIAGTALKNTPSVNLLHSLGFKLVATEKVSFYQDAQGKDIVFDGGIFELKL